MKNIFTTLKALARDISITRAMVEDLQQRLTALERFNARALIDNRQMLVQCGAIPPKVRTTSQPTPPKAFDLEQQREFLNRTFPVAFPQWIDLFEAGRVAYETTSIGNLSVGDHPAATLFRGFISPYMGGNILDVGCGPQALPSYLEGHNIRHVAGIDPLPGDTSRRFKFVRGYAEFLPWADGDFDVVIFGTSLDHVLSVDMTICEVKRVLVRGGHCIVWTGITPQAAVYDPYDVHVRPVDKYHMFHFSIDTLRSAFSRGFLVKEQFMSANEAFLVLQKI